MNKRIVTLALTALVLLQVPSAEAKMSKKQKMALVLGVVATSAAAGYFYRDNISAACQELNTTIITPVKNINWTGWVSELKKIEWSKGLEQVKNALVTGTTSLKTKIASVLPTITVPSFGK